ncbi:amidoligase enzyme [Diplodia corticola]|uniref:Amidoligase enzyme n=1 Tax=Diplodia corticola TaxID=236234 RepID=A0A1J9SE32_9PEZI|nr:amidoligase enzyme [Diplodia corticola]OJD38084.1 amidoligase enzyme [Diplodia corticola]
MDIPMENDSDPPLGKGSDTPMDMGDDFDIPMRDRSSSTISNSSSSANISDASFTPSIASNNSGCTTPPHATGRSDDVPQRPGRRAVVTQVGPIRPLFLTEPSVPLPLTVGIELEMLLVYDLKATNMDYGDHDAILMMVIKALSSAGVNACHEWDTLDLHEGDSAKYARWGVGVDMSAGDAHPAYDSDQGCLCRSEKRAWGCTDFMDYHRRRDEYGFLGLELKSPKYALDGGDDWRDDVRRTLKVLHGHFDDRASGDCFRLYQHDTTGVHVHVGVGTQTERHRLPLESVKSFMQLVTGFERITDELHATTRFDSRAQYCAPPSQHYRWIIPQWLRGRDHVEAVDDANAVVRARYDNGETCEMDNSVVRWCQEIEKIGELNDIEGYENRETAYNLQNLDVDADGNFCGDCKGTIEFRQHRGTTDADEIFAWVEVVTSMVRFAHTTALTGSMLSIVKQHVYDPAMGLGGFLHMIGVADKTVDYYSKHVEKPAASELPGSRLTPLTSDLARRRQQQKDPAQVMRAILLRLASGDYGVPIEVSRQLVREKYPPVDAAPPDYKWKCEPPEMFPLKY